MRYPVTVSAISCRSIPDFGSTLDCARPSRLGPAVYRITSSRLPTKMRCLSAHVMIISLQQSGGHRGRLFPSLGETTVGLHANICAFMTSTDYCLHDQRCLLIDTRSANEFKQNSGGLRPRLRMQHACPFLTKRSARNIFNILTQGLAHTYKTQSCTVLLSSALFA
jgi:hypothetical protein